MTFYRTDRVYCPSHDSKGTVLRTDRIKGIRVKWDFDPAYPDLDRVTWESDADLRHA